MRNSAVVILCVYSWTLSGCEKPATDPVLAKVGDRGITASQLRDFEQRLPQGLKTKKVGVEGNLDYLQTLIDKEVYIQEAQKRGLDQQPEFLRKLKKEKEDRILRIFYDKEVAGKIILEQEELQDRHVKTGRDREIKAREIVVENRQRAEEILRKLKGGSDFAELARKYSLHKRTAERGGELTGYTKKDDLLPLFREKVFPLRKGELSGPLELPSGYCAVFQIVDERPVSLEAVRRVLEAELMQDKSAEIVKALTARLRDELNLRLREAEFQRLVEGLQRGENGFSEADLAAILYQFDGGEITLGDFLDLVQGLGMNIGGTSQERIRWMAAEILVPRRLCLEAAYRAGIGREAEAVEWLRRRRDTFLLQALRRTAVTDKIHVGESAVRQYYDQHPDLFMPLVTITIQEILVKTEEEAVALKERIERGEDMGKLAEASTLRVMGKLDNGRFHMHSFENSEYGELFEAAREAPVGQFMGPTELSVPASQLLNPGPQPGDKYYSIFKVLQTTGEKGPEPFSQVEKRAGALVRRQMENQLGDQFLLELRQQYKPQISVYRENVEALTRQ